MGGRGSGQKRSQVWIPRDEEYPEKYKEWRLAVIKRDKRCKFPECGKFVGLQAHHIKMYSLYPELRYEVSNGISLCSLHHRLVTGNEQAYEALFMGIVGADIKTTRRIRDMLKQLEREGQ